jgi:hypothetical protein
MARWTCERASAISTRVRLQSAVCLVAGITLEHHHHHQAAPAHPARGPISPVKHPFFPSGMYEEPFAETLIEHHAWTVAHSDFGPIDDEYKLVRILPHFFSFYLLAIALINVTLETAVNPRNI